MLVAGLDSSTQSAKVVLCRAEDGAIVATGSAPHPDGTECDPAYWWEALCQAGDGLLDRASAIGVARGGRRAVLEPLGVALHSCDLGHLPLGDTAAVIGCVLAGIPDDGNPLAWPLCVLWRGRR